MRAEGGVRYACVGVVGAGRRGVDGPAMGSDAMSRRDVRVRVGVRVGVRAGVSTSASASAFDISTSSDGASASSDEADSALLSLSALRTGSTRRGVVVVVLLVRGRFDGVSGARSSSEAEAEAEAVEAGRDRDRDRSENEKATLRFALLVRAGVRLAFRRADLVGEAERDCAGVLIGVVFDGVVGSALTFFLRISLIVTLMDSLRSTHSSSIIFTRRENVLSDTPCLSTNGTCCTVESWCDV